MAFSDLVRGTLKNINGSYEKADKIIDEHKKKKNTSGGKTENNTDSSPRVNLTGRENYMRFQLPQSVYDEKIKKETQNYIKYAKKFFGNEPENTSAYDYSAKMQTLKPKDVEGFITEQTVEIRRLTDEHDEIVRNSSEETQKNDSERAKAVLKQITEAQEKIRTYEDWIKNYEYTGKEGYGLDDMSDDEYENIIFQMSAAEAMDTANIYAEKAKEGSKKDAYYMRQTENAKNKSISQNYIKLYEEKITKNDDFEKLSQTRKNNLANSYYISGVGDVPEMYEYITADDEEKTWLRASNNSQTEGGPIQFAEHMSKDEQKIFVYLYNTQGEEAAERYRETIESRVNKRIAEEALKNAYNFGEDHPIIGTVGTVITTPVTSVLSAAGTIKQMITGDVDENDMLLLPARKKQKTRQGVIDEHIDTIGGRIAYGAVTSAADNFVNFLVAKGVTGAVGGSALTTAQKASYVSKISGALMSSEAAAMGTIEALEKGLDGRMAVGVGIAQGAVEFLTEKYSVETIMKEPTTILRALKKATIAEGTEELTSNWANRVLGEIAYGKNSDIQTSFRNYLSEGATAKEAFKKVVTDIVMEDVEAFGTAMLSAGMMTGIGTGVDVKKYGGVKNYNNALEQQAKFAEMSDEKLEAEMRKMQKQQAEKILDQSNIGQEYVAAALSVLGVENPTQIAKEIEEFKKTGKASSAISQNPQAWQVFQTLQKKGYFKSETQPKYSIGHTMDNERVVVIDGNILEGVNPEDYAKKAKEAISKFKPEIPVSGRLIKVTRRTSNEYTNSKNANWLKHNENTKYVDKMNAAGYLDEIVLASTNYVNEDLQHERDDDIKEFARGSVLMQIGDNKYNANVIIGLTDNGEMLLYDVVDMESADFEIKKQQTEHISERSPGTTSRRNEQPANESVSQKDRNVKPNVTADKTHSQSKVDAMVNSLLAEGKKNFETTFERETESGYRKSKAQFLEDYNRYYLTGLNGRDISKVDERYADTLSYETRRKAYNAGKADRSAAMDAKYAAANQAVIRDGGLIKNHNSVLLTSEDADIIDKLGKMFGVSVEVADIVTKADGTEVNGDYKDGQIRLSKKALGDDINKYIKALVSHEIAHRVQELSPKEYQRFRDIAYELADRDAAKRAESDGIDIDGAVDEVVADFVARKEFAIKVAQEQPKLAEKIKNWLKDILDALGIKKYDSIDKAYRMWEKAVNTAQNQVENQQKRGNAVDNDTNVKGARKVKYSEGDFRHQIDAVFGNTLKSGYKVFVGKVSNLLVKCGFDPDLVMLMNQGHVRDINKPKNPNNIHYHGLSKDIIKQIPKQLKEPVMIYDSISDDNENAVCVVTSLRDGDKLPIIITLRANSEENNKYLDVTLAEIKTNKSNFVTSMYGKDNFFAHIQEVAEKDAILYANKNKTSRLYSDSGLYLPTRLNNLRFDTIIHQSRNIVKSENKNIYKPKYSMGGINALIADKKALKSAQKMEKEGRDENEILKETGWYKGIDGKWKFEINDKKALVNVNGFVDNPKYVKDFLKHKQLFDAYPQLADVEVEIRDIDSPAWYDAERGVIVIRSNASNKDFKRSILHELQHVIQFIEGFAKGASPEFWAQADLLEVVKKIESLPEYKKIKGNEARNKFTMEILNRFMPQYSHSKYMNTAGEIEARQVQERVDMSNEERRNNMPFRGDENTVFAEGADRRNIITKNMSDEEIEGKKKAVEKEQKRIDEYKKGNRPQYSEGSLDNLLKESVRLTKKDIERIQNIGRKSVNDFTSEEIKNTKKFAQKYFEEMGTKSPFFRAWFGDWRANDNTVVEIATKKGSNRGITKNVDTGWNIQISGKVFNETKSHNGKQSKKAVPYLEYIDSIVEKAILFDSYTISKKEAKSENSAMMHSFYSVVDTGNGKEVLKIFVEELNDVNSDGTLKRSYKLILPAASARVQGVSLSSVTNTASNIKSVSDLFDFVKLCDKNFNPKPCSLVLNYDGTPMVMYHGTEAKFTEFDMSKGRANMDIQGAFFSPWELDAKGYGQNVGKYYLNIKNPADGGTAFAALNRFKGQNNAGIKAREYLINQGFDGVDFYGEKYVAFYPSQIKSATDNVGTFDGDNPDIRYSEGSLEELIKENEEKTNEEATADYKSFVNRLSDSVDSIKNNKEIFEISGKFLSKSGKVTQRIEEYFKSIGGKAVNPRLGIVELNKKGSKTTVFHGISNDKINAVAAIKDVIEKGQIISHDINWKGRGYDTYLLAGNGKIDGEQAIVGVIIKNYPKSNLNNKFYLHEVIKIGASHTAVDNNTIRVNEQAPIDNNSLSQNKGIVNTNHMQNSAKNSEGSLEELVKENDIDNSRDSDIITDKEQMFADDQKQLDNVVMQAQIKAKKKLGYLPEKGYAYTNDYFVMYDSYDVGEYKFGKAIWVDGNEELIEMLEEEIESETVNRTAKRFDTIIKNAWSRKRGSSGDNVKPEKGRMAMGDAGVHRQEQGSRSERYSGRNNEDIGRKHSQGELDNLLQNAQEELEELNERYGVIDEGENPARTVKVPKKISDKQHTRRYARTAAEAEALDDNMAAVVLEAIGNGAFAYETNGDKRAWNNAKYSVQRNGYEEEMKRWDAIVASGKGADKNDIALGTYLIQSAANAGDQKNCVKLIAEVAAMGTQAGQTVQAMRLLKKMDGAGQLIYVQQTVKNLQSELDKRLKNKAPKIKVEQKLLETLSVAKDREKIENTVDEIIADVASQVPADWLDKWNAWRYLAMLGNPRTHIRNIIGNAVFAPAVAIKNTIGAIIETSVDFTVKAVGGKGIERTKRLTLPLLGKEYEEFAKADYVYIEDYITGGGKASVKNKIDEKRPIFKSKTLEKIRKFNNNLLEKEDGFFLKKHYISALASYLQSNKIDINTLSESNPKGYENLEKARNYAVKEAQKATFRDASAIASALNNIRKNNKWAGYTLDSILPFTKTPINILKRGIEYSPVSLIDAVTRGTYKMTKGDMSANEFIDKIASGLTGTGVMLIGMFLANMGILKGSSKDEDEEFEELQGAQSYAVYFDGGRRNYTVDWAAPVSLPLFVGVEINRLIENDEKLDLSTFLDALSNLSEPIFELSMLDGINNMLESVANKGDAKAIPTMVTEMITSYFGQAVPTLLGQITRTFADDTRRRTYTDKNSQIPTQLQYAMQRQANKIPGLSKLQQPYVDEWGREEKTQNIIERGFENFISPGYYSNVESSEMENELMRLAKEKVEDVYPDEMAKYFNVNGVRKDLTAKEYTKAQKVSGARAYELLTDLYYNNAYDDLSDEQKGDAIRRIYEITNVIGKKSVSDYTSDSKWIEDAIKKGDDAIVAAAIFKSVADEYTNIDGMYDVLDKGYDMEGYIEFSQKARDAKGQIDQKTGETIAGSKQKEIIEILEKMKYLTDEERAYYFSTKYESTKNNPWKEYLE